MYPSRKIYLLPVCSMVLVWLFVSCVPPQNMVRRSKTAGYGERNHHNSSTREQHFSWEDDGSFFEEYKRDGSEYNERRTRRTSRPVEGAVRPASYQDNASSKASRKRASSRTKRHSYKTPVNKKIVKYRVKKGDTLYSISRKYGTSVGSICAINNISNKNRLYVGTVLKVPSSGNASSSPVKKGNAGKPRFQWPVSPVVKYTKDGGDGVKSIGVYIQSRGRAAVRTSASGIVEKTGNMRGFGNYVVVRHGNRYLTVYSNLNDVFVREGQRLPAGKVLGRMDARDCKLHFQINHAGKAEDPMKYLKKG